MRNCDICGSKNNTLIHRQNFIVAGNSPNFGYNVVCCNKCGFIFASLPVSQKKLDNFYKKNTKYVYKKVSPGIHTSQAKIHDTFVTIVDNVIAKRHKNFHKSTFKTLDIGSGDGHLLYCFNKKGYSNTVGIDPASECRIEAKKRYGVKVQTATFSEYKTKSKYNILASCAVLEHVRNLNSFISKISNLLHNNGVLAIAVPDTENFGYVLKEPFMEFSLEHINFFTRNSLINLFGKHGLTNILFRSEAADSKGNYALYSLWSKSKVKTIPQHDYVGNKKIKGYVSKSKSKLIEVNRIINRLEKSQEEVVVWGVGSLTSRLLADTNLGKLNIKTFIDSNESMQGKKINNVKILSPSFLKNNRETIFISTYMYGDEIRKLLLTKYNYRGKIISIK